MIPRTALELDASVPAEHRGWTPKRGEFDEEGFGGFRDTWLIRGVGIREAKAFIGLEGELIGLADHFSLDAEEFNAICGAIESADAEELPSRLREPSVPEELECHMGNEDFSPTGGLDLGVAGIVYALAAVGCWTAASCRGHPGKYAWSDHPIVVLACDRHRAAVLQTWLEQAHCGFTTDENREGLLAVVAESVTGMMTLAGLVVPHKSEFIPRRQSRLRSPADGIQERFDFGPA